MVAFRLAGITIERILAAYPGLDAERVELATIFAEGYPSGGRPLWRGTPEGGRHSARSSPSPTQGGKD
jgi:hypothetical protein